MRVLFIGTGDIGLPSLRWLINTPKHQVVAVVTQPDKPVGRKLTLTPPATKSLALHHALPVLQPAKIRHAVDDLRPLQADIAIVVAYGQILSRAVLDVPRLGCLNIHASLLPRHRGAAPIQAAIRDGDPQSGVTIMYMDEGLDTGDILLTIPPPLPDSDTGGILHDRLARLAPQALEHALDLLTAGTAPRTPQDNTLATHIGKLTRAHGRIDWTQPATQIARTIRAYDPWPGTHTHLATTQLKIFSALPHPEITSCPTPGTVLDSQGKLLVTCGTGALELTELQLEGGKRLPTPVFLHGHPIASGTILG
jgi:methionyl-tRNA formyltransferase